MSEEKIFWDAEDPLKPVAGEPSTSNSALHDYARLGYSRSMAKLHRRYEEMEDTPPTTYLATIMDWSKSFDWQDRVKRWEEIEHQRDELLWRERRDNIRKLEWDNYDRLQKIAAQILEDMPTFISRKERVVEEGKARVVDAQGRTMHEGSPEKKVIILSYDAATALRLIKMASDLGRRAAEMDQSFMAKLINDIDFSKLTPEQITRVAEGEHILDILDIRK